MQTSTNEGISTMMPANSELVLNAICELMRLAQTQSKRGGQQDHDSET